MLTTNLQTPPANRETRTYALPITYEIGDVTVSVLEGSAVPVLAAVGVGTPQTETLEMSTVRARALLMALAHCLGYDVRPETDPS